MLIEGSLTAPRCGQLYCRNWQAEGDCRAVVMIVHGMGEHCARYQPLAESLNNAGYAVCALDLPGHGRSEGTPGFQERFSDMVGAALALRDLIDEWYPGKPVFLLGHSMGGLISTLVLEGHQQRFQGGMLSGPAIQSPLQPGFFQFLIIRILSSVAPRSGVLQLDAEGVSRDPAVVKDYMEDPLVYHGKISARLVNELFAAMGEARERAGQITLPMLLMHGGSDAMTSPEGSEFLHQHIGSQDKTLRIYDGLFHEIFNEVEAPQIYAEMIAWLDNHLGESPG